MSIALEARVAQLENMLIETNNALIESRDILLSALERIAELERSAVRKPGPKPKDSNG